MSSLHKARRVIRGGSEDEDVFVLGQSVRATLPTAAAISSASELLAAAAREAEEVRARARVEAQAIVAAAEGSAATVRDAAYQAGLEAAAGEIEPYLDVVRKAAAEGKAIRDAVAEQSAGLLAQAAAVAARRIVGEYYEADPARTAHACAEALRAASGQEILSIRVHPGLVDHIQGMLVDAARYIQPAEGIEVGGCIIDLRHGTLDATLDARLSMMELALREAGGEVTR